MEERVVFHYPSGRDHRSSQDVGHDSVTPADLGPVAPESLCRARQARERGKPRISYAGLDAVIPSENWTDHGDAFV